jgi:16S rRNA (guanine966-N2)-methyltransferase
MRIVAGEWRGRRLMAPAGEATRPTSDRVRQALFDMLLHARWGGRDLIEDATVLDVFAGTGALGLEALSRGARHATFVESAPPALAALRANVRSCGATVSSTVLAVDALATPSGPAAGLVFLDPPYGQGLLAAALDRLRRVGRIAPGTTVAAETGRDEASPYPAPLAERVHGAAKLTVWQEAS